MTNRAAGLDIRNGSVSAERNLALWDLDKDNLWYTFQCVQNSWFVLLDATQGGKISTIDTEYMRKMRTHKSRLPRICLFDSYCEMRFKTKKYQANPNRFVRVLLNALRRKSAGILMGDIPGTKEDAERLMSAFDSLKDIYISRNTDTYTAEIQKAWAFLSEMQDWEDVEECDFESNLQMDLFYDAM